MKTRTLEDGRVELTMRQSSFGTFGICQERARRENLEGAVQVDTDAAVVGTCVHAAIELDLSDKIVGGEGYSFDTLLETFNAEWDDWSARPTFRHVKYNDTSARKWGGVCLRHWYDGIREQLDPIEVEWGFNFQVYEDDWSVIRYSGTCDLIDRNFGLVDWKTSGRGPYQEWEKQRWAAQPTVYTQAYWDACVHGEFGDGEPSIETEGVFPIDFTYGVMHANGIQVFRVQRGPEEWAWQLEKAKQVLSLIDTTYDSEHAIWDRTWPTNDEHALCSPLWCPEWSTCKGTFVTGDDPWRKNQNSQLHR